MKTIRSRRTSFAVVAAAYAVAALAGVVTYWQCYGSPLWSAFWADVAATVAVWIFAMALGNASVYDPYWSVAPIALGGFWLSACGFSSLGVAMLLAVLAWGGRLTTNWIRRWRGLEHQDWRYTQLHEQQPRLFPLVNLFGIHMMPTVLVFLGMIPVYDAMMSGSILPVAALPGLALCAAAITLELVADAQMDAFRRSGEGGVIARGLWRWCRHPNYLGEVLFWWGLWLAQALSVQGHSLSFAGAMAITALFVFISVPMMDRHMLARHSEYADTMRSIPALLPWKGAGNRMSSLKPKI